MRKMAPRPSSAYLEIIRLSDVERLRLEHPYLGDEHVLLAVLAHGKSSAAGMLRDRGVDLNSARDGIARAVAASGPVARDDAAVLREFGVDVSAMRRRLESTLGAVAVHEAARHVRRRPWWRGRAHRSPLCGPPYLIKRAQFIACTTAGGQGAAETRPEHLLYALLRVAREPLGTGLGRRGRQEAARLGYCIGAPHPLSVLLTEHNIDLDKLGEDLLARASTG